MQNYPLMRKDETPQAYARRHNLNVQAVFEALRKNEILIEGAPAPAPPTIEAPQPVIAPAIASESETPKQRREEWRTLHREGNSIGDIAAKSGVSYTTVYQFLVKE